MNKYLLISICIVLCLSVIFILKKKQLSNELELTYSINAGIPFKWEFEIEDESVVQFVKKYVIQDDNKGAITGAKVYTNYVFKGLKEGVTKITFKIVSITGEYIDSNIEVNKVKVDANNNISLVVE